VGAGLRPGGTAGELEVESLAKRKELFNDGVIRLNTARNCEGMLLAEEVGGCKGSDGEER